DRVQPPAATLDDGSDPLGRQRPRPGPRPSLPGSRGGQILREISELALPSLDMAFMRPQLGWQARKARLDDEQTSALDVRLERELDAGHRRLARVGMPPKREALRWLDGLDDAAAGAAWASRTIPGKNNFSAWSQINACLRTEPGTELIRLRQRRPDPRGRHREDDLTFDRVGDVHRNLCLACNWIVAHFSF